MGIVGGNERIQCIEINQNSNKPILIICVYMPTSGGSDKTNEYHETVDLLNEKKKMVMVLMMVSQHIILIF